MLLWPIYCLFILDIFSRYLWFCLDTLVYNSIQVWKHCFNLWYVHENLSNYFSGVRQSVALLQQMLYLPEFLMKKKFSTWLVISLICYLKWGLTSIQYFFMHLVMVVPQCIVMSATWYRRNTQMSSRYGLNMKFINH